MTVEAIRVPDNVMPPVIPEDIPVTVSVRDDPAEVARQYKELVRRVVSSTSFERSPRLRAFLLHVCRCAIENKPEEATEQQIGIHVYDRVPGYNQNEDNVVRTAARLLRLKLEHHFVNEGKDEPIIITIPKGRYLPTFEPRTQAPAAKPELHIVSEDRISLFRQKLVGVAALCGVLIVLLVTYLLLGTKSHTAQASAGGSETAFKGNQSGTGLSSPTLPVPAVPGTDEVRIAAGRSQAYVDVRGRHWGADRYLEGGISRPGLAYLFPPVADPSLFKTMREAGSSERMISQGFRYDIPLQPGAYELRLYFADPLRQPESDKQEDGQNVRHFQVNLNGRPLLEHFDAVADAGAGAVSVRVFKDVAPAPDGRLHLEFSGGQRPFVNAVEVTPGVPGKLKPIRIAAAQAKDFVDADGTQWSGDDYFVGGRTLMFKNADAEHKVPAAYMGERYGNFSYAIPVSPGSYTVRLHFLESFFSPVPTSHCRGVGCRVFDVSCNGVELLKDFDIVQAASGAFQPVVKEFHGLRPNGQGKLLLSFSPKLNYAEVRAIEVIEEGK